jgi:hypothetical protein
MLTKDEELGCFEILKNNFPNLNQQGLVIGVAEFLSPDVDLKSYICLNKTVKDAVAEYASARIPYIILDESEGYQCIFFKGYHIKVQYDVTHAKMLRYIEEPV